MNHYHFDQLGSTRLLTNSGGAVTDEYSYDAYGAVLSHNRRTGSVDQPYQYVGQLGYYMHYQEPGFGLIQTGVRFYGSESGVLTQRNPGRYGHNAYVYAGSKCTVYVDPDGRKPKIKGLKRHPPMYLKPLCDCLRESFKTSCLKLHERNDKWAHCYMWCKAVQCTGGGLLQMLLAPLFFPRDDPNDTQANYRGISCARDCNAGWSMTGHHMIKDCYTCCKDKVKDLPNEPGKFTIDNCREQWDESLGGKCGDL
ncbi:MAG: hypothetical protein GX141_05270 [Armatimonadetes bacterium]|nr:hypothetical protein [Armatimonadota bacterium]